jgi:peptide methionine sulfoxide reductase MsrA
MTTPEIVSLVFGGVGIGGTIASIYVRATIAETIITKLNGRYTNGHLCLEKHTRVDQTLSRLDGHLEQLNIKTDHNSASIRELLAIVKSSSGQGHDYE